MKSNSDKKSSDSSQIKDNQLAKVLNANKDLYDKLNKIPEIEAIQSIEIEKEETPEHLKNSKFPIKETVSRIRTSYIENECILIR